VKYSSGNMRSASVCGRVCSTHITVMYWHRTKVYLWSWCAQLMSWWWFVIIENWNWFTSSYVKFKL